MKRRFWWIGIIVVTCVALVAGAFVMGRFVRSPNEEAIANSRNAPRISADVEERAVPAARTEVRGTLTLGKSWNISVTPRDGSLPVVTEVYLQAGATLYSGSALASVSGRPVIGLALPFDLYRDIQDGDSGTDVRELQHALQDLGLYNWAIDGEYGPRTAEAVEDLYLRADLTPPKTMARETTAGAQAPAGGQGNTVGPASGVQPSSPSTGDQATGAVAPDVGTTAAAVTPLPRSEIISLPAVSVTVISVAPVNTHVGTDTPLAELRSGWASASARIGVGDKDVFPIGTVVDVRASSDTQLITTGSVSAVSDFGKAEPDKGKDIPGYDITVNVADPKEMSDGQEVIVIVGSGEETRGLAVPITALREDGGDTFVILTETGARVPVTVKTVSEGYAIVENTTLIVGDSVIVSGL